MESKHYVFQLTSGDHQQQQKQQRRFATIIYFKTYNVTHHKNYKLFFSKCEMIIYKIYDIIAEHIFEIINIPLRTVDLYMNIFTFTTVTSFRFCLWWFSTSRRLTLQTAINWSRVITRTTSLPRTITCTTLCPWLPSTPVTVH